jgi:PAS domain S-box-containing protein
MLGYSKEELSGLSFDRLVDSAELDAHLDATQEFFEGKRSSFKVEARYVRKVGDPLWGSVTVERIEDSTEQMLFVLIMDISERRRAAEERERMIDELNEALANRQDPARANPDLRLLQEDPRRQGLLKPGRGLRARPLQRPSSPTVSAPTV